MLPRTSESLEIIVFLDKFENIYEEKVLNDSSGSILKMMIVRKSETVHAWNCFIFFTHESKFNKVQIFQFLLRGLYCGSKLPIQTPKTDNL